MHALNRTIGLCAMCAALACSDANHAGAGGSVQITVSGEVLALGGYAFPAAQPGDPVFVDGWEITFDQVLVTIDNITLSANPDRSPTDQSKTDGAVARVQGPWAVDLHQGGPLPGKGGSDEQAVAIATLDNQNLKGGAAFDASTRYAFGFDIVPASADAQAINLDADAQANYATMSKNGWTVLYVGTATWKGSDCTASSSSYDFGQLPSPVHFELGFASPTSYVNCQNPDNDPAKAFASEEHQRGIQIKANTATVAQVTVHTDHPFWQSFQHDSPAHFDQLAARAKAGSVTLDDARGLNFTAFQDSAGHALPWRSCSASFTPPDRAPAMHFDSLGVPYDPHGDPSEVVRDYREFMTYDQSTQGHLNSDGLCFVKRNYPSPD